MPGGERNWEGHAKNVSGWTQMRDIAVHGCGLNPYKTPGVT